MIILVDMNLPPMIATTLTQKGIPAEHWYTIGAPGAMDTEIMEYAQKNDCVVLTCDLDFTAMLSITQGRKPSIIQIRKHGFVVEELANMIVSLIQQYKEDLEKGAILTIDPRRTRVRLLPLGSTR